MPSDGDSVADLVRSALTVTLSLRHELHAHPELMYEEHGTAQRLYARLMCIPGLDIRQGVGGTGIIAVLGADRPGPCVALRADMDALPIQEITDKPYKSKTTEMMHACGHDGHMACLVGAAIVLSKLVDRLPGPVKFVFQPAEEGGNGAVKMIDEGVLDDPPVAAMFALHAWPWTPLGSIACQVGATMASVDDFHIVVEGIGAHAAYPHRGVDPIVIAAQIVTALQSIVSRQTNPVDTAVVTVGQIHAGTARNIIPPTAELRGTVRALNPQVRAQTEQRLVSLVRGIAEGMGGRARVEAYKHGSPVLANDASMAKLVHSTARSIGAGIELDPPPSLGGEDFAFYAERVPAAFWRLGIGATDGGRVPELHQPDFDFCDKALELGIRMHCELALSEGVRRGSGLIELQ